MRLLGLSGFALVSIGTIAGAEAQTTLLTPDWTAPAASRYLEQRTRPEASIATSNAIERSGQTFSLPVLGLVPGFDQPNPTSAVRESFIAAEPSPIAEQWWPACAKLQGPPKPVNDPAGTWYTLNYDFDCIFVRVTGDRNSVTNVPASLIDQLSELKGDTSSSVDEENDPNKVFMRSYTIKRFGIPYIVEIECTDASIGFCKDEAAQRALLARLSIVDGAPTP